MIVMLENAAGDDRFTELDRFYHEWIHRKRMEIDMRRRGETAGGGDA